MANRLLAAMCGAIAFALLAASPASAAKRIALVVGNDSYSNVTRLQKAVNDARSMSSALEELGFSVIRGENLTRRDMNRKLSDLDASIAPGDTVLFFFAGHGVAIGADNFLLPVDMPKPREGEEGLVRDEAHGVDDIIRRIQGRGAAVSLLVLDACRDNPFAGTGTRNLGLARGLARIEAPSGVFVLYSAGIGQTALDRLSESDTDTSSVFTRKLVPLLRTPGLSHVALAKKVQQEVDELAQSVRHAQQPAYYDQIVGEIVLKAAIGVAAPAAPLSEAADAWAAIERTTSIAVLEAYISRYTGTVFADLAAARLGELQKTATVALAPAAVQSPDSRAIEVEMKRIGCFSGEPDAEWTEESRAALAEFSTAAGAELEALNPDDQALAALKASTLAGCSAARPDGTTQKGQKAAKRSTSSQKKKAAAASKRSKAAKASQTEPAPQPKRRKIAATAARQRKLPSCDSIATLPGGMLGKRQQKRLGNCE